MEIYFRKTGAGIFVPEGHYDQENFDRLKYGVTYKGKISRPRNLRFHNKYMSLIRFAYNNQEEIQGFENFRRKIQILAGHYEGPDIVDGKLVFYPKPINFSSMEQEDFEVLYQEVLDAILSNVLKGMTDEELEKIVMRLVSYM